MEVESDVGERDLDLCLVRSTLAGMSWRPWFNTYYFAHPSLAEQGEALGLREVSSSLLFWNYQCRSVDSDKAARLHLG